MSLLEGKPISFPSRNVGGRNAHELRVLGVLVSTQSARKREGKRITTIIYQHCISASSKYSLKSLLV